jgi:hypothetical protein
MVDIKRKKILPRRVGGNSSSFSSSSMSSLNIIKIRNLILFLAVIQGLRMLTGLFFLNTTESASKPSPSRPMGLKDTLKDSVATGNVRKPKPNKQQGVVPQSEKEDEEEEPISHNIHIENERNDETAAPNDDGVSKKAAAVDSAVDLNPIVIDKKGTGPTKVGYVKDFIYERENPVYRNLETIVVDHSPTVAKLVNEKSVIPCQTNQLTKKINPACLYPDTVLIAYNPESFTRTWCGQEIKPESATVMTEHCMDPTVHLFPTEIPPITGDHMPPIIIKSSIDKELQEGDLDKVECNIPCQQEKGLVFGQGDRFIGGESWKITQAMANSKNVKMERTDFMKDHYYSTQSLLSSVPLTNFDVKIHSLRNRPAIDFDTAKEKAIYLVENDCSASSTKRNRWYDGVEAKIKVDSYGHCGHNIEVPEGMTTSTPEGRIALMKQYRIVLAFDDATANDHISSMVWEAFVSGAVPVVVGADNIRDRLPPNSFINVKDYQKWDDLANYVEKVVKDKELWNSYHKWRDDDKIVSSFEAAYEFSQTDPTCRLCRWAYAKKYGLGWDHTKQVVRSIPKIPKDKFCTTADHGLVSKPFSEIWVTKSAGGSEKVLEENSDGESCSSLVADGDAFKGHRKVVQHDGVTDFIITESKNESTDTEVILRLKFPGVRNPDGACFYNTHTLVSTTRGAKVSSASIQDNLVKVTIIADWETSVRSTGEGIMELVIQKGTDESIEDDSPPKRIRIIIEDISPIHDKMTEYLASNFSKLMIKDFVDPVGIFFVDS